MCRADGRVRVIGAIREIGGKSAQRELLPEGFDHDGRNPQFLFLVSSPPALATRGK
jgi:hypothetical protein